MGDVLQMPQLPCATGLFTITHDLDVEQPRLILSPAFGQQFPRNLVAEFRELPGGILHMHMVDPKTPPIAKRYKVLFHNGSYVVSIPRTWLRDRLARVGDQLTIHESGQTLYLRFVSHHPPPPARRWGLS